MASVAPVRRALSVVAAIVLLVVPAALAAPITLSGRVVLSADLTLGGDTPQTILDPPGDIYHPAGTPGFKTGEADITGVSLSRWMLADDVTADPFDPALTAADDIWRAGPIGDGFATNAPYLVVEYTLAGTPSMGPDVYCEYPVAWRIPNRPAFEGIEGDLFNGTNSVAVLRFGPGVDGGFAMGSFEFDGTTWVEGGAKAYGAAADNQLVFALPGMFGAGGDGETTDFNFGAFCSEGEKTFDPAKGGADILVCPIDLMGVPLQIVANPEEPTTTLAPSTTVTLPPSTTSLQPTSTRPFPSTTGPFGEKGTGGGINPALIAIILAGLAGLGFFGWRVLRDRPEQKKSPPGGIKISIDGGPSGSFSEISGFDVETPPIDYREGSDPPHVRKLSGLTKYGNITLHRGTVVDPGWFIDATRDAREFRGSLSFTTGAGVEGTWEFE